MSSSYGLYWICNQSIGFYRIVFQYYFLFRLITIA